MLVLLGDFLTVVGTMTEPQTKFLTLTLEVELGDRRTHTGRVEAAHQAAVSAAVEAIKTELLEDAVERVQSRIIWGYRRGAFDLDYVEASGSGGEWAQDET
ncbi:hypothetical protein [Streptomyces sp. NPDC017993]|uniref:hypothetical protein n=1 Tax=Streptomyces sp. NPDC017993 TaxID=3365027 RepID=UPI0037BA3526